MNNPKSCEKEKKFVLSDKYQSYSNTVLNLDKEEKKKYFHKDKFYGDGYAVFYFEEDVKEFIRRLKKEIYEDDYLGWRNKDTLKHYSKIINKLVGVKLK